MAEQGTYSLVRDAFNVTRREATSSFPVTHPGSRPTCSRSSEVRNEGSLEATDLKVSLRSKVERPSKRPCEHQQGAMLKDPSLERPLRAKQRGQSMPRLLANL